MSSGVNFTNILRAAFTCADPESTIKLLNLTVFFALLGSAQVKAACKHVDEIDPRFLPWIKSVINVSQVSSS